MHKKTTESRQIEELIEDKKAFRNAKNTKRGILKESLKLNECINIMIKNLTFKYKLIYRTVKFCYSLLIHI